MRIFDSWKPVYITVCAIAVISIGLAPLGYDIVASMITDDGLIQVVTAFLLCISVVLVLSRVIVKQQPVLKWIEASCILGVYAMRELDFHRMFTTEHVTRLKLYTGPFPLEEKLIGATIWLLFFTAVIHFCITNVPLWIHALKRKVPRAWYVVVWALLLIGAQILDKPRFLRGWKTTLVEETMELGAAVLMIFIVLGFVTNGGQLLGRKKHK
jgi:hypothetical protein